MIKINPYLNFAGNTEEAFIFYKSVFGGEFPMIMRFGDMPAMDGVPPTPDKFKEKIMHIALPIGEGNVLMGTDAIEEMGHKVTSGTNFHISISPGSKEEADKFFNGLSAGGKITMPIGDAFWGAYFGSCVDRFGISWMVNYEYPKK